MNVTDALDLLQVHLRNLDIKREMIICGGASLVLKGVTSRVTQDIDVIAPEIDEELKKIALIISEKEGFSPEWLNNGPSSLIKDLSKGWEERIELVYQGSHLKVFSLGFDDLLFSKVFAYCDRQEDFDDIISLNPLKKNFRRAIELTKKQDANPDWSDWVDQCRSHLEKALFGE